jgi:site-specific DNA-methyltransferase (adenine-specific)
VFPIEIPRRLIKLFTFYGDVVLDPFAGTGVTAEAAIPLGRKAVCVEQNRKYVDIIARRCRPLRNGKPSNELLEIRHGDSRQLDFLPNDSVGLAVTSPPYWNKANYGRSQINLGNVSGYLEFIDALRPVFQECYRVLMPGRKLCVVTANVNQHTDFGLLCFPLAADLVALLRSLGFMMINEIVWNKAGTGGKWGSWGRQRPIFGSYPYPPNFLFKNVHEYVLVFAKPNVRRTRGPKVVPLAQIMRSPNGRGLTAQK